MKEAVYFVGAGPGDKDLITVKGMKVLQEADVIIYAGSLVSPELLDWTKEGAQIYNSAGLNLNEVLTIIKEGVAQGKKVVRLHTGDPTIYGAIREQIDNLEQEGIECRVIPGVSSFTASAAAINKEFTLPSVSQTVILTRMEGRTPVPEEESLVKLASHRASMAIFLSVGNIGEVVEKLTVHYPKETPVAVVCKATWNDQKVVEGTLETIEEKVKEENIQKTAQILVGDFLGDDYEYSKLYDPTFTHEYRQGISEKS